MNYLLTIDKLTINTNTKILKKESITALQTTGNHYTISTEITVREIACLDKFYKNSFEVYAEREQIATLFTDSKVNPTISKIAFSKHILYTQPGLRYYIELLEKAGIYAESINYLEIALDYQTMIILIERICKLRNQSNLSRWTDCPRYIQASARGQKNTVFNSFNNDSELTFGASAHSNKGNGKQIALYVKSEKMESYQENFFRANNFDMSKPIQRIEARIKTNWLNKQKINKNQLSINIYHLFDKEILNTLFIKAVGNTFIFNDTSKEKKWNKNKNKVNQNINLFPLDFLTSTQLPALPKYKSEEKERNNVITIKTLVHAYMEKGTEETAAALRLSAENLKAPKGKNWPQLVSKYQKEYEGKITHSISERLNSIIPINFN